jgi:serpin B
LKGPISSISPRAARQAINEAVAKQTAGKITDFIEQGLVDTLTRVILVNAVNLSASWEHQFPAQQTRKASFYPERSDPQQPTPSHIDMMHLDAPLSYHDGNGYQAVLLPYEGGPIAMAVVLPDEPLSAFAARLPDRGGVAGLVRGLLADSKERQVDLRLPRFRISAGFRLRDTLRALGVVRAFGDDADFGGMLERSLHPDDAPLRIREVVHKAFVDVDEEGTEAAAVSTAACMAGAAFPVPKKRKVFTADRPFLFAIVDTTSGLPLFLGQFTQPPKG